MSLTLDPRTAESLILAYETVVATRLVSVAGEMLIDVATVCGVLGLGREAPDLTYCEEVLAGAKRRAAAASAQRSTR